MIGRQVAAGFFGKKLTKGKNEMNQTLEKPENGGQALAPVHGVKYLLQQSALIEEMLKEILKPGIHYGKIPGCGPKPVLLKPGAEKIMAAFQIRPDLLVEDLSTESEITYRVIARGLSSTGAFLGSGVGECSSGEVNASGTGVLNPGRAEPVSKKADSLFCGGFGFGFFLRLDFAQAFFEGFHQFFFQQSGLHGNFFAPSQRR